MSETPVFPSTKLAVLMEVIFHESDKDDAHMIAKGIMVVYLAALFTSPSPTSAGIMYKSRKTKTLVNPHLCQPR